MGHARSARRLSAHGRALEPRSLPLRAERLHAVGLLAVLSASRTLYRCADIAAVPASATTELVSVNGQPGVQVLGSEMVVVLRRCRRFATLDDHAAGCARAYAADADHERQIRAQLGTLVDAGLMISRDAVLAAAGRAPRTAPPPPISTVGVVTRDGPEALGRALRSYVENARAHGRTPRFVVADDSAHAETRSQNRQHLEAVAGARLIYADHETKRRFAAALSREADVSPDVIEFALFDPERCGLTFGANRNALMLETAGELVLTVDDDTECRVAPVPGARRALACTSTPDPTEFWFFGDRADALRAQASVDVDVLALHERLLGRDVAACLAESDGPPRLDRIGARLLRQLLAGRGRVLLTMNGIAGDSGTATTEYYLRLRGASRRRLLASEDDYRAACESRAVIRATRRPTIYDGSFCTSAALGLDQRDILPPYFPVLRGEDSIFGVTVRRIVDDGLRAFLPWTVAHDPAEKRRPDPDDIRRAISRTRMADVVIAAIRSCPFRSDEASREDRLCALGRHLIGLGGLAFEEYDEMLRRWWRDQVSARMTSIERDLETHGDAFAPWASDVTRSLEALHASLDDVDAIVPRDPGQREDDGARALSQRLLRRFGQLLEAWPELIGAATRLRDRGESLATARS